MTIMIPSGGKNEDRFVTVLTDGRKFKIPKGVEVEWPMNPQTNADRIRAMSDEELATFIYTATRACNEYDCESCPIGDENCPTLDKWLKQPAEEEA